MLSTWARSAARTAGHDQARRHALAADVGDGQADVVVGQGDEVVEIAAELEAGDVDAGELDAGDGRRAVWGSSAAARRGPAAPVFPAASASSDLVQQPGVLDRRRRLRRHGLEQVDLQLA